MMTLDPETRTPADYADLDSGAESTTPAESGEIEEVYSVADAARAAGAWSED